MTSNIGNWILTIIQLIISAFSGMLAYIFKKEIARLDNLDKRQSEFEKDVLNKYVKKDDVPNNNEVMKAINKLEVKMGDTYVRKDDFYRYNGELTKKLDSIYELLIKERSK